MDVKRRLPSLFASLESLPPALVGISVATLTALGVVGYGWWKEYQAAFRFVRQDATGYGQTLPPFGNRTLWQSFQIAGSEEYPAFYEPRPPSRRPPRSYSFLLLPIVDLPSSHPAIKQLHHWHETALHRQPSRRRRCTARKGAGAERRYRTSDALILSELRLRMVIALRKAGEEVREQARRVMSMSGVVGRKRKRGSHECGRRCKIHSCRLNR
ncbi:hypothetical protein K440DRAFT_425748 [Wilcoxina mikolae CBS 423.85]|nr:hypothetical protein K440DRAFT_425748 [Wilcoxina mikolae CBS 423.85]